MTTNETLSIQKSTNEITQIQLNNEPCRRTSDLAHFLPCQVFYQDIFQIIDAGPSVRRSLLDWGMFHVKHSYLDVWKDYKRVLKQRNALLKKRASQQEFTPWDNLLIDLSIKIDEMRYDYFNDWKGLFTTVLKQLTSVPCDIFYYKGWDRRNTGKHLREILKEQFPRDLQYQYTHYGAHQADITFETPTLKAKQILSRGQQKIILIALKLAQASLLKKPCIYLLDDITAELDAEHLDCLINHLLTMEGQFFITAIEPNPIFLKIDNAHLSQFSIANGAICSR